MSKKHNKMRERARVYRRQVAWVQVEEQERDLQSKEDGLQQAEQTVQEMKQRAQVADEKYAITNRKFEEVKEIEQQTVATFDTLKEQRNTVKDQFDKNRTELTNVHV